MNQDKLEFLHRAALQIWEQLEIEEEMSSHAIRDEQAEQSVRQGQIYGDLRIFTLYAFERKASPVLINDAVAYTEPEPGPAFSAAPGVERVEEALLVFLGDARSVVFDGESNKVSALVGS